MCIIRKIDRTNEVSINNQGLKMFIKTYRNKKDIDIQFEDGFVSKHKRYSDFKEGGN